MSICQLIVILRHLPMYRIIQNNMKPTLYENGGRKGKLSSIGFKTEQERGIWIVYVHYNLVVHIDKYLYT